MRVRASKTWEGRYWHIKRTNEYAMCGSRLRQGIDREMDIKDPSLCGKCRRSLFMLLNEKKVINEILKTALV